MPIKTVIVLGNFTIGLINFVKLSKTFFIQRFLKFFIFFHKKTFIIEVNVIYIYESIYQINVYCSEKKT